GQAPLTIIDGVQREIYSLDPESIASVSILKDALSTVLLGQNSSRGALLVTTKLPQPGAPHLSFTAETGTQTSLGLQTPLAAYQYAYLLNEALLNDGRSPAYTGADFDAYRNGTDPNGHPDVNWYNTILRKNPLLTRYNLNVNGGGNTARYIVSLSYLNQDGHFKTDNTNSYNTNKVFWHQLF
ncbi:MAG: SusC/RagA family TonB-linked outer membrane protein, partial [Chryseobacterium sp.]